MQKNVSSQKLIVYAFDSTTNLPKTGDAANITAYVSKDFGATTVLGDTSATEQDATNAKGFYLFDLTQAETNADTLLFSAKSSTSNIVVLGMPATVYTVPANFTKAVIDAAGLFDANVVKVGPTGAGTAQTAGDLKASLTALFTTALTESYRANAAAPTVAQALCELIVLITEQNISGTINQIKKFDHSTNAMQLTLSDATNPVTVTRST